MAKKKKKVKSKLSKPSVSLTRNGYKFEASLKANDSDATHFHIEKWIWEAKDTKRTSNKNKEYQKWDKAVSTSSVSFTLNKNKYYPFVGSGQSNYNERIDKIVVKVWTTGVYKWTTTKKDGKKKKTVNHSKNISSDAVTVTYEFDNAIDPKVSLEYNQSDTSLNMTVDINDDYGINSTRKKVATRAWVWVTKKVKGGKETDVSGWGGKWYNRDTTPSLTSQIAKSVSPDTPVKFIAHSYAAGPGGKSGTKTAEHIFARPNVPSKPTVKKMNLLKGSNVDRGYGLYMVTYNLNKDAWHPVDNVTIEYRDQTQHLGASDSNGEDMGNWQTAKSIGNGDISEIETDELGAVADDSVRYFRIKAEHDGNVTPGWVTGAVSYGKISNVSGLSATADTVGDKQVLVFKWTNPSTQLFGTDPDSKFYNGDKMGYYNRLRIVIFKNTTQDKGKIKTIYYPTQSFGDQEWKDQSWVYEIPSSDLGKDIDYCFQVRIGKDNLDPGGISDNLWLRGINVPAKCTKVRGTKQANNTTVQVTWSNPIKDDTVRNGVEIAWSTMPNAFESNNPPSTTTFANGAMTKAYITGLTAGEVYYFWVRLYDEQNGTTNYGIWSDISPGVLLADDPDVPVLTLSRSWIKDGGNLSAQWTYYASGNLPQKSATIYISSDKANWITLTSVSGEDDRCTLDFSNLKKYPQLNFVSGDYYLRVSVSNDMGSATSEPVQLTIAEKPTCSITSTSIIDYSLQTEVIDSSVEGTTETTDIKALRSLPLTVTVAGNGDLNLYVYCIDDYARERPGRIDNMYHGDCIWTSPVEAGTVTISDIELADNAKYRVQVECVDPDTLLTADSQYIDFKVIWEHQAVEPDSSEITINADGTAVLVPVKPEGASDTDVCDIYRTTADGRYLCYQGAAWGTTIIDKLPTFGDVVEPAYCFCTRTTDGDEAWCDLIYELDGSGIIVNYGNEVLNLPWNVTIDDSRSKQGEIRSHLGGTKTFYGQPYIDRSQSLSTEIVKMENEDLVGQLYDLSRYTELCYVRTSNCVGYPATVDVTINREYNNSIISVSLSAKEADAETEFLGKLPDVESTEETTA